MIAQGGGDFRQTHRCAGEWITLHSLRCFPNQLETSLNSLYLNNTARSDSISFRLSKQPSVNFIRIRLHKLHSKRRSYLFDFLSFSHHHKWIRPIAQICEMLINGLISSLDKCKSKLGHCQRLALERSAPGMTTDTPDSSYTRLENREGLGF